MASIAYPFRFVVVLWLIFYAEVFTGFPFSAFGIIPRTQFGLLGILFAPLLHAHYLHLISNSIPLLILGTVLFFFYNKIAGQVFFYCYFATGLLVWIFARPSIHIGASGLVYGIAFFLFSIGFSRKDFSSLIISFITVFFYGGIFYGVFPGEIHVSWESHFMGAIVGIYCAFKYGKDKNKKYSRSN
jgi:membrane associated rhomboid family serine protease